VHGRPATEHDIDGTDAVAGEHAFRSDMEPGIRRTSHPAGLLHDNQVPANSSHRFASR
jgi:hypothetical protein